MKQPRLVLERLQKSPFRQRFHLTGADAAYLRDKGVDAVMEHAARFVDDRLAAAEPANDGKQTPWRGHPVFVAQHATATCCRGCLAKWHRIEKGRELTDDERRHVLSVLRRWLEGQRAAADATGADRGAAKGDQTPSLFE